jgi:hypothetical protein
MRFTQSNVNDLLVLLTIITMGDVFRRLASYTEEERSKTWLKVTIDWMDRYRYHYR